MSMDNKCELASAIVDYIWFNERYKSSLTPPHHSFVENKDVRYTDEAQDIFNQVLDIIDEYVESDIEDVVCRFGVN